MDAAAVDAAKRSIYAPGETNCAASAGTFAVQYSFVGTATAPCPREALAVSVALTTDLEHALGDVPIAVRVDVGEVARFSTYVPKLIAFSVRRQAAAGQTASKTTTECRAVPGTYMMKFNGA